MQPVFAVHAWILVDERGSSSNLRIQKAQTTHPNSFTYLLQEAAVQCKKHDAYHGLLYSYCERSIDCEVKMFDYFKCRNDLQLDDDVSYISN